MDEENKTDAPTEGTAVAPAHEESRIMQCKRMETSPRSGKCGEESTFARLILEAMKAAIFLAITNLNRREGTKA